MERKPIGIVQRLKAFFIVDYINLINLFQYFFFLFSWSVWFFFSRQGETETKVFSLISLGLCTLLHSVLLPRRKLSWAKPLLFINLLLTYWISIEDPAHITFYFYDILIAEAVVFFPLTFAIRFSIYSSLTCLISLAVSSLPVVYVWRNLISFLLVFFFMLLTVDLYKKRLSLAYSETLLAEQKKLLEKTNQSLRQSINALEEMVVLKERNRIAREIHDNVGHSLTAAVIQIEAGIRLASANPGRAVEKLLSAQDQVRCGLEAIRQSVRTLSLGEKSKDLLTALKLLIIEAERHFGVVVESKIENLGRFPEQTGKAVYYALKEGLTNGVKHGKATRFSFSLENREDKLSFQLRDNGGGCDGYHPGFGLSAMKDRVEEAGGAFSFFSDTGNGCLVEITFPK
ncbi:MAG TPA: sensor histidine kinase [Thermotogota bacterium]|nr:sensor histidine kinase [Thermotogota bacterium]